MTAVAKAWVLSVPNFSEGRDKDAIAAIVACFEGCPGCFLLDHRADPDHNRLVVSLAGEPDPLTAALLTAGKVAIEKIDLNRHAGSHPRIGAVDVIPFTPLSNISLDQCVNLAHSFGQKFWAETGVPVYFYEAAARMASRRNLEAIRKGQFEGLKNEISLSHRKPDIGAPSIHPTAGATVIGARKFLVAFNINLATQDIEVAKSIAGALRAASGGLGYVKAIGLALADRKMVQVSCNVTDFERNPLYRVLEFVRTEARQWGISVVETEIYGMVPSAALFHSARYYLQGAKFDPAQSVELRLLEIMGAQNP